MGLEVALEGQDTDDRRQPSRLPAAAVARSCSPSSFARLEPAHRLAQALRRARDALGVLRSASSPRRSRGRAAGGSSDLKMPEPTNTPSAPSCIISAASAGVAMPPAQNSTTGSLPASCDRRGRGRAARAAPWPRWRARPRRASFSRRSSPVMRAHVAHRLDDVAGAGLALGADHRRALADAPQRLAEVRRAADERHLEAPTCRCGWPRRPGVRTSDSST